MSKSMDYRYGFEAGIQYCRKEANEEREQRCPTCSHLEGEARQFASCGCDRQKRYVTSDPQIRGGEPVIAGTRFPVAQLLAELAEGRPLWDIADDYDLDLGTAKAVLRELAEVEAAIRQKRIEVDLEAGASLCKFNAATWHGGEYFCTFDSRDCWGKAPDLCPLRDGKSVLLVGKE